MSNTVGTKHIFSVPATQNGQRKTELNNISSRTTIFVLRIGVYSPCQYGIFLHPFKIVR